MITEDYKNEQRARNRLLTAIAEEAAMTQTDKDQVIAMDKHLSETSEAYRNYKWQWKHFSNWE